MSATVPLLSTSKSVGVPRTPMVLREALLHVVNLHALAFQILPRFVHSLGEDRNHLQVLGRLLLDSLEEGGAFGAKVTLSGQGEHKSPVVPGPINAGEGLPDIHPGVRRRQVWRRHFLRQQEDLDQNYGQKDRNDDGRDIGETLQFTGPSRGFHIHLLR
jgi:hypothetical protein